jgi:hypothetical protein
VPTGTDIVEEPRDQAYHALLDSLLPHCTTVLLVVRDTLQLSDRARGTLDLLHTFELERTRTNCWPGTELLLGQLAEVRKYRASPEVAAILKTAASGLYDWQQPGLPEDLCLLAGNGEAVLTSIAHERDACVALDGTSLAVVRASVGQRFFRDVA